MLLIDIHLYICHKCENVMSFAFGCRKIERVFFITLNKNAFMFLWIYQTRKIKKIKQDFKTPVMWYYIIILIYMYYLF